MCVPQSAFSYGLTKLKATAFIKQRWDRLNPDANCQGGTKLKGESALGIKDMSGLLILSTVFFCIFVGAKLGNELGLWNQEAGISVAKETGDEDSTSGSALSSRDMAVLKKVFGTEMGFVAPTSLPVNVAVEGPQATKVATVEQPVPQMQTIENVDEGFAAVTESPRTSSSNGGAAPTIEMHTVGEQQEDSKPGGTPQHSVVSV